MKTKPFLKQNIVETWINKYFFLRLLTLLFPTFLLAEVKVNNLFSDHMVIQRETTIPIWGWADANEIVNIETSWGASAQVTTNNNGTWRANIKTPKAGGPHKITLFSLQNKITINDVLSGEVWLCTGQSNMDFPLSKYINDAREKKYQPLVEIIRNEVATAKDDWIRHIEVPQTTSLYGKKINFVANWRGVNPEQIGQITATGYFFAKELRKYLNVPIGLVECAWGGTRVQPWISEETYLNDENMKAYFETSRKESNEIIKEMATENYVDKVYENNMINWKANDKQGRKPKPKLHPSKNMQLPATLHNGMISSIVPFKIRGAIWYQGESNAVFMTDEYEYYLTAMINSWRLEWGQGNFSFYWAQLASCKRPNDEADKGWAKVNNQLRKTMKLPNTGMAVLHDIGEAKDIHPHNKMDAGKRLALWALSNDYDVNIPIVSGPLYKSKKIKKSIIEIEFNNEGSGLMVANKDLLNDPVPVDEPLKSFEIIGKDGKWKSAKAKIISKNKIEVWSTSVTTPVNVRYAWSGTPDGPNLYNKEGLPAAVFSTE